MNEECKIPLRIKVYHNGFRVMIQGIFSRLHIINTIPNKIEF